MNRPPPLFGPSYLIQRFFFVFVLEVAIDLKSYKMKDMRRECKLSKINSLIVLSSQTVPRLAIFSFRIYVPMIKKHLHYNFICSLLNDLFGIQVLSSCACAKLYVLVGRKLKIIFFKFNFDLLDFASDKEID